MPVFLCRLLPPRPSFMVDMSDDERALMAVHVAYWTPHVEQGTVIALGPVADVSGGWGLGIMEAETRERVEALTAADPAIRSGRGFSYEIHAVPRIVLRKDVAQLATAH